MIRRVLYSFIDNSCLQVKKSRVPKKVIVGGQNESVLLVAFDLEHTGSDGPYLADVMQLSAVAAKFNPSFEERCEVALLHK